MATMNRRTPPAIIKLNTVIPKILRIAVPPIANIISTVPEVIIAVFESAFRSSFFIFCVIAIKRGTVPIGFSTTKVLVKAAYLVIFNKAKTTLSQHIRQNGSESQFKTIF
jgi:hypothetical protein